MCIGSRAPHCRTVLQNGQTKPRRRLPGSSLSWNTCQNFMKIPSHWEASLEIERRYYSKVIFESNVTPNITRSSDSFSTVPPIVNAGDWGCIECDLETLIVLVLLAFNFIPQWSHHSLTLTRLRLRYSATVTLTPGDARQLSKWSHRHNGSACSPEWKKAPRCTGGTITGPKPWTATLLTQR